MAIFLTYFTDFHDLVLLRTNSRHKEDFPMVHRLVVTLISHSSENFVSSGYKNRAFLSSVESFNVLDRF